MAGAAITRPYREGEPWTPERLREWLKNPRKVRPMAVMPPVVLEEGEGEGITKLLTVKRQMIEQIQGETICGS